LKHLKYFQTKCIKTLIKYKKNIKKPIEIEILEEKNPRFFQSYSKYLAGMAEREGKVR